MGYFLPHQRRCRPVRRTQPTVQFCAPRIIVPMDSLQPPDPFAVRGVRLGSAQAASLSTSNTSLSSEGAPDFAPGSCAVCNRVDFVGNVNRDG